MIRNPLFAVADGMGGHRGGSVASRVALDTLERSAFAPGAGPAGLMEMIRTANREVFQMSEADEGLAGMGTTVTALFAEEANAHLAHVGDSRAYLLRADALMRLTEDHTLVHQLVRAGRISEEEARYHPSRSLLTRAVGLDEGVLIDEVTIALQARDRVLLCTDGLTSMVEEEEVAKILGASDEPNAVCDALVDTANGAGGRDNITAVVLLVR